MPAPLPSDTVAFSKRMPDTVMSCPLVMNSPLPPIVPPRTTTEPGGEPVAARMVRLLSTHDAPFV